MAYRTGAVLGVDAVLSELVDFATTEAGWELCDDLAVDDKVICSNGEDGKIDMTYRISSTLNPNANPFFKAPMNLHRASNHVIVQGYHSWNPVTRTGLNSYGQAGPFIIMTPYTDRSTATSFYRYNETTPPLNGEGQAAYSPVLANGLTQFDGTRMLYGVDTGGKIQMSDLVSDNTFLGAAQTGLTSPQNNMTALVYNVDVDNYDLYVLGSTTTQADQWWKYSMENEAWTRLTSPAFGVAPLAAVVLWAGNDFVYVLDRSVFRRYSISGNSWTTLTAPPVARHILYPAQSSSYVSHCQAIYVPGAVTGGNDSIYVGLSQTGMVLYRYDVVTNAWGTGNITVPTINGKTNAWAGGMYLIWDHQKYMYFGSANESAGNALNQLYRADLSVAPDTWTNVGNGAYRGSTQTVMHINQIPAKIRANHSANTKFWFVGDKDSITVCVELRGHYYWMYFGRYDQYNNTAVAVLTAAQSPALIPYIQVDSTAGFSVGDKVTIFDTANGSAEQTTVFSVESATVFRANLTKPYGIGARVGVDPAPFCVAGNGVAVTPIGPKGYMADMMNTTYAVLPPVSIAQSVRNGPNPRGAYHLYPQRIVQENSSLTNCEDLGNLRNIYGIRTGGGTTNLRAEDIMYFNGKQYIIFPNSNVAKLPDNRWVALGPLE